MNINLDKRIYDENKEPVNAKSLEESFLTVARNHSKDPKSVNLETIIKEMEEVRGTEFTIGLVCRRALCFRVTDQNEPIEVDEAQRRYNESLQMEKGGMYDLSEKDRDIIKNNMTKMYGIEVIGQVMNELNPVKSEESQENSSETDQNEENNG